LTLPALGAFMVKLVDLQIGPLLLWLVLLVVMRRGLDWRLPEAEATAPLRSLPSGSTVLR
jgi:hypothetical protein